MLEQTMQADLAVGSNPKGAVGATWLYLLPSMERSRVLCWDMPSEPALAALARSADQVIVRAAARGARRRAVPPDGVRVARLDELEDESVDVAWLPRARAVSHALQRVLRPDAVVFAGSTAQAPTLLIVPRRGELRLAAPAGHEDLIRWLARHGFSDQAGGRLRRPRRRARVQPATAALLPGPADGRPPAYVRELAAAVGIDLDGYRWALSAPGRYESKKVLLLLFAPGEDAPSLIVKMSRNPARNHRLENEWHVLRRLAALDRGGMVPEPRFFGHHAGLAILGQSAIQGIRFARATTWAPGCPVASAAVDRLIDIGARTATAVQPAEVAGVIAQLLDRFVRIYGVPDDDRVRLATRVEPLTAGAELPAVLQHGDPGTWNILSTGQGVALLDWEAAETRGMPLWDLFYFLRSYGVGAVRAASAGRPGALDAWNRAYMGETPLNALLVGAVARACTRLALAGDLIEPLMLTCWMHRALKEATRLEAGRLRRGHYAQLVLRCLHERDAPGLLRLFAAGGTS